MKPETRTITVEQLVLRKAGEREYPSDHPRFKLSFGKRKIQEAGRLREELKSGKWWWVWDCPSAKSFYHIGFVKGEQAEAIKLAKEQWPQYVGRMRLEPCTRSPQKKQLRTLRKVKGKLIWIGNKG